MAKAPTKRMGTRKLTVEQQHFIVTRLACYTTIKDVQIEFEAEYGQPIERNLVGRYDPTRRYTGTLAQRLVELFEATRKNYEQGLLAMHPISKKVYRVDQLGRMFETAYDNKNLPFAAQLLKQAAEEMAEIADRKTKDSRYGRGQQSDQAPEDAGYDGSEVELGNLKDVLTDAITRALGAPSTAKH